MFKRILPLLMVPMLMGGCTATFTNLTPTQQIRNANNHYRVEVAFTSRQQTLRWDTIQPQIVVGTMFYPMSPAPLITNRWEGWIEVPANVNLVHYRYKFDFLTKTFGEPMRDSANSQEYTLRILEQ